MGDLTIFPSFSGFGIYSDFWTRSQRCIIVVFVSTRDQRICHWFTLFSAYSLYPFFGKIYSKIYKVMKTSKCDRYKDIPPCTDVWGVGLLNWCMSISLLFALVLNIWTLDWLQIWWSNEDTFEEKFPKHCFDCIDFVIRFVLSMIIYVIVRLK